MYNDLTFFFPL